MKLEIYTKCRKYEENESCWKDPDTWLAMIAGTIMGLLIIAHMVLAHWPYWVSPR